MIERKLFAVLSSTVAAIKADTSILLDIFQPEGDKSRISDAEMTRIRALYASDDTLPRVRHGYPPAGAELPCFCVVLSRDTIAQAFLDDFMDIDASGRDVMGVLENRTISLYVFAENPDLCFYHYKVLKATIIANLKDLITAGLDNPQWDGEELEPIPNRLPEWTFQRVLRLTCLTEETYPLTRLRVTVDELQVYRDDVHISGTPTIDGKITLRTTD